MRLEARLRARARVLRAAGVTLLQTAVAAGIAWHLAHDVLGHKNAFFAPVAAVIALGLAPGGRTRRTVEMVVGVAVGIAIGDLLISAIGTGAAQIGLVVLLAMATTTVLGGGPLIASQAASSAVLVATVRGAEREPRPVALPRRARGWRRGARRARRRPAEIPRAWRGGRSAPVVTALATTLEEIAGSLESRDLEATARALERARGLDTLVSRLHEDLVVAEETTRIAPSYWRERGRIARYEEAAVQVELAVRNSRVLGRAAVRAVELEPRIPPQVPDAIRGLAAATRQRRAGARTRAGSSRPSGTRSSRRRATAMSALDEPRGFAVDVLVGQIRSIATDLLRALGLDQPSGDQGAAIGGRGARGRRLALPDTGKSKGS